jgi:Domain of unknown function (DUF932)
MELILPEAATDGIKFEKLSDKYDLISTESVVELMREEGFTVTQTNTLKPRKRDPRMVRHFVRMRHESYLKEINGSVPEIMVINANDGSSSLRMEAGLFRFVCSNGLIVKSQEIASARIRHVDVTAERVLEEANRVIQSAQEAARRVDIFRQRVLNNDEKTQFSVLASALWGGRVMPHTLLESRRPEDSHDDLWHVFNRVQENLIKGGVVGRSPNGRNTRTHGIRAMDNTVKVNMKLWEIAENML